VLFRSLDSKFKNSEHLFESSRWLSLAGLKNGGKK